MTDYYETLGVARNATQNEIKGAFRKLAQQYHPDVSDDPGGSEERFVRILESYEVLGDPEKRRAYDLSLAAGTVAGLQHFDIDDFSRVDELEDLLAGELLETLFGRRGGRTPRKGKDLRFDIELELEEALRGASREVLAPRTARCDDCGGTGTAKGGAARPCPVCSGLGQVKALRARGNSKFVMIEPCQRCGGNGKVIEGECKPCAGKGKTTKQRPVTVHLPAGVEDGAELRLPDEGAEGLRGGPRGDLYLVVRVRPHPRFARDGPDLSCTQEISFPLAALGGRARLETLDGTAELEIPAGTQGSTVLRLPGLGMPRNDGPGRGDLLVTVVVKVPSRPTERMKALLAEMERPEQPRKRGRRWRP
jgi:molecular chaperone DnaJ